MRKTFVALLLAGGMAACAPVSPSAEPSAAPPKASPTPAATPPAAEPTVTVAPTTMPTVTSEVGVPVCEIADLKASHGLVEGDADVRQTEIVLVSAVRCLIDATPSIAVQNGAGSDVAERAVGPGVAAIDLRIGVAYSAEVRIRNWCDPAPVFPLTLMLLFDEDALIVSGSSFPQEDDLPPCTSGGEPVLEPTAWVAAP